MMAVAVKNFQDFLWSRFLIIRQNLNMATNAILNSGITPLMEDGCGSLLWVNIHPFVQKEVTSCPVD